MRGGSHRHTGKPVPPDAGWEVGLGHQMRGRKGVCQGKEEEGDWSHPTDSFQPKANCSGSKYCVLALVHSRDTVAVVIPLPH